MLSKSSDSTSTLVIMAHYAPNSNLWMGYEQKTRSNQWQRVASESKKLIMFLKEGIHFQ